jgi:hypothetical protein
MALEDTQTLRIGEKTEQLGGRVEHGLHLVALFG